MEEKKYILTESQLFNLLVDRLELQCLEEGGVDNWSWYGENRIEFIANCLDISENEVVEKEYCMDDVANKLLENYKEVQ